jgi:hypothetical protein
MMLKQIARAGLDWKIAIRRTMREGEIALVVIFSHDTHGSD